MDVSKLHTIVFKSQPVKHTRSNLEKKSSALSWMSSVSTMIFTRGFSACIRSTEASARCNIWNQYRCAAKHNGLIMHGLRFLTFFPTSCSERKNCAPRSSSETDAWSRMVTDPTPASTRFLQTSLLRPRMFAIKIFEFRMLHSKEISNCNIRMAMYEEDTHRCCASRPQSRICLS